MGIRYDQQSAYVQERRKWEIRPTVIEPQWVSPQTIDGKVRAGFMDGTYVEPIPMAEGGKGGWPFMPYPKTLFKAIRADGGPKIDLTQNCSIVVQNEQEDRMQQGRGWYESQEAAIEAIHAEDREWAKLAAERNFEVRRMSEKARAEVQAVDDVNSNHVPEIPHTPIKKRGRPVKVAPVAKE